VRGLTIASERGLLLRSVDYCFGAWTIASERGLFLRVKNAGRQRYTWEINDSQILIFVVITFIVMLGSVRQSLDCPLLTLTVIVLPTDRRRSNGSGKVLVLRRLGFPTLFYRRQLPPPVGFRKYFQ